MTYPRASLVPSPSLRRISKTEALTLVQAEAAELDVRFAGCAMCAAVSSCGARYLASNSAAIAMLDRFAARPLHVVVVLRRHVESMSELPWDDFQAVQRLAWEAARALTAVLDPKRIYVASLGSASRIATSFPHHHVHVVPLTSGGEEDRPAEVLTWRHGVYVYDEGELQSWAERLRAAW